MVCSKGENSTWLVSEENAVLVEYDPADIADKMEYYLKHEEALEKTKTRELHLQKQLPGKRKRRRCGSFEEGN